MTENQKYKTKEFMQARYPEFVAYAKYLDKECDCSNDCCQDVWSLEAKNYEEAVKELKFLVLNKFKTGIDGLALFKVADSSYLPVKDWYNEDKGK